MLVPRKSLDFFTVLLAKENVWRERFPRRLHPLRDGLFLCLDVECDEVAKLTVPLVALPALLERLYVLRGTHRLSLEVKLRRHLNWVFFLGIICIRVQFRLLSGLLRFDCVIQPSFRLLDSCGRVGHRHLDSLLRLFTVCLM